MRQPDVAAMAGKVAAATAPPSGKPACRMPIAKPSRPPRNQAETDLLPPGWVTLKPKPATSRHNRSTVKSPLRGGEQRDKGDRPADPDDQPFALAVEQVADEQQRKYRRAIGCGDQQAGLGSRQPEIALQESGERRDAQHGK